MKKPKYITADNYLQFKPSEFVRSFASDLAVAKRIMKETGKVMDLYEWTGTEKCLPCVGGMACMNLGLSMDDELGECTARLGDAIRKGALINFHLKYLYPNYLECSDVVDEDYYSIGGVASIKDLDILIKRIHKIADLIESSGQ